MIGGRRRFNKFIGSPVPKIYVRQISLCIEDEDRDFCVPFHRAKYSCTVWVRRLWGTSVGAGWTWRWTKNESSLDQVSEQFVDHDAECPEPPYICHEALACLACRPLGAAVRAGSCVCADFLFARAAGFQRHGASSCVLSPHGNGIGPVAQSLATNIGKPQRDDTPRPAFTTDPRPHIRRRASCVCRHTVLHSA